MESSRPTSSHRAANLFPPKLSPLTIISDADYDKINQLLENNINWLFESTTSHLNKDETLTPIQYATYLLDIRLLNLFQKKIHDHLSMKEFAEQIKTQKTIDLNEIPKLYRKCKGHFEYLEEQKSYDDISLEQMEDSKKMFWNELSEILWDKIPSHMLLDFLNQKIWNATARFDDLEINANTKKTQNSLAEYNKNKKKFIVRGKDGKPSIPDFPPTKLLEEDALILKALYETRITEINKLRSSLEIDEKKMIENKIAEKKADEKRIQMAFHRPRS